MMILKYLLLAKTAFAKCLTLVEMDKLEMGCSQWTPASWTTYTSYAACCQNNPNYDPKADTTDCTDYSACLNPGIFAYLSQQQTFAWVKSNNIVSFFTPAKNNGSYVNKNIRINAKVRLCKLKLSTHVATQIVMAAAQRMQSRVDILLIWSTGQL